MTLEKTLFGKYQLVSPLSQKKQSETWLAQHSRHSSQAVVKLIPGLSGSNQSFLVKRCFDEFKPVSRLYHSAILPVLDYGSASNYFYIVMPYCQAGNLAVYLERERPSLSIILKLFQTMLEGLEAAHENGVISGRLKPANILINEFGQPAIADLGIVKILSLLSETDLPQPGEGTDLLYLAPEQIKGQVTKRSDVYAMGAILYRMLTGNPPDYQVASYQNSNSHSNKATFLSEAAIPHNLIPFLTTALKREPQERFVSAGGMLTVFSLLLTNFRFKSSSQQTVKPVSPSQPTSKPAGVYKEKISPESPSSSGRIIYLGPKVEVEVEKKSESARIADSTNIEFNQLGQLVSFSRPATQPLTVEISNPSGWNEVPATDDQIVTVRDKTFEIDQTVMAGTSQRAERPTVVNAPPMPTADAKKKEDNYFAVYGPASIKEEPDMDLRLIPRNQPLIFTSEGLQKDEFFEVPEELGCDIVNSKKPTPPTPVLKEHISIIEAEFFEVPE